MRHLFTLLFAAVLALPAAAQSIPRNDLPRFTVDGQLPGKRNGVVMVTFGVSMSDCIKAVEIENVATKRKVTVYPTLDHYYVRDSDMEEIYAKIPVGKFRKMVSKKDGFTAQITVISKSGRQVYRGRAEIKIDRGDEEDDADDDKRTASK